jgi:ParB family chromosome partitioning protein
MATTRTTLQQVDAYVDESVGLRYTDSRPQLSSVPSPKDIGRRPLRDVGRIDIDQVVPDPEQPRSEFSQEAIDRLSQSIREQGQLLPIGVRWSSELEKWVIISGERRWRATKAAGLTTIDCYFRDKHLSPSQILEQQLVENLLREDLKPIEEARAFSSLMKLNGWNGKQVASALRVPASKVSRALALLDLPDDIQQRVNDGEISARTGYELSKLPGDDSRRKLAERALKDDLTHEDMANVVRQKRGKQKPKTRGTTQTFMTEHGWRVVVSAKKKGTYYEIEQALQEALDEVRHRIDNRVQIF